jgi:hypothetical protein
MDFSGGLNQAVVATMIKDNQASDINNCYIDNGAIVKRDGCQRFNAKALNPNKPVTSITRYYREDGTKKLIGLCGSSLYYVPDNGSTPEAITGASFTDGARLEFETYINFLYMTNQQDGMFKYDNTQVAAIGANPIAPPAAKHLLSHDERMWAANGANNRSRLWFSAAGDPTAWVTTDDYFDISSDDGDEITGLASFLEDLVVFKQNSIWIGQNTYDPQNEAMFVKRVTDAGCVAGRSIATINNRIYFLGKEGVYEFDGVAARLISEAVKDEVANINPTYKGNISAVAAGNKYYIAYTPLGSNQNTKMLVYDTMTRAWSKYDGLYAHSNNLIVLNGSDDSNEILSACSDSTGIIYKLNTGTSDDGDTGTATAGGNSTITDSSKAWTTNMWIGNKVKIVAGTGVGQERVISGNSGNELTVSQPWATQPSTDSQYLIVGKPINFLYDTGWFAMDVPESKKKMKKIWVYTEASGNYALEFTYFFDLGSTGTMIPIQLLGPGAKWNEATWGQASWGGTSIISDRRQAQGQGRYFKFRFANNGADEPITIYGVSSLMKVKRPR